jgi:carbonic anhydrase/acetyltransferase-like protein (isoleucine patch superfamily)
VLRADLERITVHRGANIQDGSVLHADGGTPCDIGPGATIAHLCLVRGATIGDEVLAMGSPAKVKGPIKGTHAELWVQGNPPAYQELAQRHRAGITEVS